MAEKSRILPILIIVVLLAIGIMGAQAAYAQTSGAWADQTLNATFHKADLAYGPQAWKPYFVKLPIVSGNDPACGDNFYLMFVDLYATPSGRVDDKNYTGGIRVDYSFKDLPGTAAFHVYGFNAVTNGNGSAVGGTIAFTNRIGDTGENAYYVNGASQLAGAAPAATAMDNNNVHIKVANGNGPKYNVFNDGTYLISFTKSGGGLNAMHITSDPARPGGQITYTGNQSGTFYVMYSGGNSMDDTILLVAVNGSIPDTFEMDIKTSMDDLASITVPTAAPATTPGPTTTPTTVPSSVPTNAPSSTPGGSAPQAIEVLGAIGLGIIGCGLLRRKN